MMLWWHWLLLGLLLAIAELVMSSNFYLLFFGVGAMLVGLLVAGGVAGPLWMQLVLFAILSTVTLVVFRRRLVNVFHGPAAEIDTLIGEVGAALEPIVPGSVGRVELRGSHWNARNDSASALAPGARCRVVRVDGLTLHVEPEGAR